MEIFGIPVVFTVRDMLSLGWIAIVLCLWAALIPLAIILWVAEKYIEWREKGCG